MRGIATIHFRDQDSGDAGVIIVAVDEERRTVVLTTSLRQDGDVQANLDAGALEQLQRALMEAHHQLPREHHALDVPAPEAFVAIVKTIADFVASANYDAAIAAAPGSRLTASDLADAVGDYPQRLAPMPARGVDDLEIVRIEPAEKPTWHVAIPVWTEEEGRSDLTLELWVKHLGRGLYQAEILNLHVL